MQNEENFFKTKRKELHMTQNEVAELLGVTYQTISKWERGLTIPQQDRYLEVAEVYRLSARAREKEKGEREDVSYGFFLMNLQI